LDLLPGAGFVLLGTGSLRQPILKLEVGQLGFQLGQVASGDCAFLLQNGEVVGSLESAECGLVQVSVLVICSLCMFDAQLSWRGQSVQPEGAPGTLKNYKYRGLTPWSEDCALFSPANPV